MVSKFKVIGLQPPFDSLPDDELELAKFYWKRNSTLYTNNGVFEFWPDEYFSAFKAALSMYKLNTREKRFEGTLPELGFGVRAIIPEDVAGDANGTGSTNWDVTWGTADERSWIADQDFDNTTAALATPIKLEDNADDFWYTLIFGIIDVQANSTGIVDFLIPEIDNNLIPLIATEQGQRINELQVSWFSNPILLTDLNSAKISAHLRETGTTALIPIGMTILTARRSKVQVIANMPRPIGVA